MKILHFLKKSSELLDPKAKIVGLQLLTTTTATFMAIRNEQMAFFENLIQSLLEAVRMQMVSYTPHHVLIIVFIFQLILNWYHTQDTIVSITASIRLDNNSCWTIIVIRDHDMNCRIKNNDNAVSDYFMNGFI